MDLARAFIANSLNRKSIIVQRGSFIHSSPTPVQKTYICSDFLYYDQTVPQRLSRYSLDTIKWHKISDPYISNRYIQRNPEVFIVGQPSLGIIPSSFQPLNSSSYGLMLTKISFVLNELDIRFHILNIHQSLSPLHVWTTIVLLHSRSVVFQPAIFIGFYSSLLLQMHNKFHPVLLIGADYENTIFSDLIAL